MVTRSLLGNGLVIAEGEEWRAKRQGIEPVFHPKRMEEYQSVITSHTQSTIDRIFVGRDSRFRTRDEASHAQYYRGCALWC